jgi:hypothetical protein
VYSTPVPGVATAINVVIRKARLMLITVPGMRSRKQSQILPSKLDHF